MRKRKALRLFVFAILALIVIAGSSMATLYWAYSHWYGPRYDQGYSAGKDEVWGEIIDASLQFDPPAWNVFHEAWRTLKENYIDELPSDQELVWAAIQGIVDYLNDPYVMFLSAEEYSERLKEESDLPLYASYTGSYGGVAFFNGLGEGRGVEITAVLEGSSAENVGLEVGDIIIAVARRPGNWRDLRHASFYENVVLLGGLPGTKVWLKVNRVGETQPLTFEVELTTVEYAEAPYVWGYLLLDKVGYLKLYSFEEVGANAWWIYGWFRGYLEALLLQGAEVIILDLRDNSGGHGLNALLVADELLPEGKPIVRWIYGKDRTREKVDVAERGRIPVKGDQFTTGGLAPGITLVVLANKGTASAAEVLAGALQDHERGVLIGEVTHGKGTGFDWYDLPDGSGLWIKDVYWETPLGRNIDGVGITPDIVVPMPEEPNGTDPQLEKALECALALLERTP